MTTKMYEALALAVRNRVVFPTGNAGPSGSSVKVNVSVIRALAARGLVVIETHSDGGIMGRVTEKGVEVDGGGPL